MFESRQPPDIQQLMAQKRELQQQLQREESEKQELFMQINQLIGEIADSRSKPVVPDLSDENGRLKAQVSQLTGENENLQREISTTRQKLREELESERNQLNVMRKSHNLEVERLKEETQRYMKELENSNAAIQSLKLAKSLSNDSNLQNEVSQLKSQVESLTRTNQDLSSYKKELEQNLAKSKDLNSQLESRILDLESRYRDLSSRNSSLFIKLGLSPQSDVDLLERKIDGLREEKENEVNKRKTLENEVSDLRKSLNSSNSHQTELTRQINDLKAENTRLQDSESLEDELHTLVSSLQAAKDEAAAKDSEINQWRSRAISLDEQIAEQKDEISRLR
uniref:HOOK domain-containing protein n=2 Tax=Bursaphelenchus xylophilus TaxID=6326 RepID=A0A1I7RXC0_BURXY